MEPDGEIAGSSVALNDTSSKSRALARLAHSTEPPLEDPPVQIAGAQSYQKVDFDDTIISTTVSVGLKDDDVPSSDGSVEDKRPAPASLQTTSLAQSSSARRGIKEQALRESGATDGGPTFKDQVRSVPVGDQARPPARLPQPKLKQQQHGDKVQGGGPDYKDQAREVVPQPKLQQQQPGDKGGPDYKDQVRVAVPPQEPPPHLQQQCQPGAVPMRDPASPGDVQLPDDDPEDIAVPDDTLEDIAVPDAVLVESTAEVPMATLVSPYKSIYWGLGRLWPQF